MRALRFFGLTLVVAAAHLTAWKAAAPRLPQFPAGSVRLRGDARPVAWVALSKPAAGGTPAAARVADDVERAGTAVMPGSGTAGAVPAGVRHAARAPVRPLSGKAASAPGDRAPGAGTAGRWPTYPTRPPASLRLEYLLLQTNPRGALPAGHATLAWSRDAGAFTLRLAAALPGRPLREWQSEGGFDAAGVAPHRLAQRDRGRETRAVEFDRARARVGPAGLATAPGVQDRWSWVAQLAAIAAAGGGRIGVAHLQVAGLRGDLERWTFRALPDSALPPAAAERIPPGLRAAPLLHLIREPERPFDLRIELWVGPATHYLPVALRLGTPPGSWAFELWLESTDPAPDTS